MSVLNTHSFSCPHYVQRIWTTLAIVALLFVGCSHKSEDPAQEKESARWERMQAEAERSLLVACTNDLVGLNRIVYKFVNDGAENPTNWTADITAEYVNHIGGVDRTNLSFVFGVRRSAVDNLEHVFCLLDLDKIRKQQKEEEDFQNKLRGK
jgi:hypothetical protein